MSELCYKSFLLPSAFIDFEGERLIFCSESGETHFINSSGAHILDSLALSSLSFNDILKKTENAEDFFRPESLLSFLDRFVELGIISPYDLSSQ